jgi:predicted ABC-type ATPase
MVVQIGNIDEGQPPKLDERARIEMRKRQLAEAGALTAAPDFDPNLHPRGLDGRFIEILGFVDIMNPSDSDYRAPDARGIRGQVKAITPDPKRPNNPDITVSIPTGNAKRPYRDIVVKSDLLKQAPTAKARLPVATPEAAPAPAAPAAWTPPAMGSVRPDPSLGGTPVDLADYQTDEARPGMGDNVPLGGAGAASFRLGIDSAAAYIDPETGRFTPERAAWHDEVVQKAVEGISKSQDPMYIIMGGGMGAGKSTFLQNGGQYGIPTENRVFVDADQYKHDSPDSLAMEAEGDSRWAMFHHEESSYLSKRVAAAAMERGLDIVLDGTGDSHVSGVQRKIDMGHENGYKVVGRYVTVPTETAVARAEERGKKIGRVIPSPTIRTTHRGVSRVLPGLLENFDDVELYEVSERDSPKLIIRAGAGRDLEVVDQDGWDAFRAKAQEPLTPAAPAAPAPVPVAAAGEDESWLTAEEVARITADVTMGVPKEQSQVPLTGEAEEVWDALAAEIGALGEGMVVESDIEVPEITTDLEKMESE